MTAALRQAWGQLQQASLVPAGAALLLYAISTVLMGKRWQLVLRGLNQKIPLRDTFITHVTSIFVNNVTPGRVAGEVFRAAMLRRRTGIATPVAIASLGWDRVTDALPVALMVALSVPTLLRVLPAGGLSPLRSAGLAGVGVVAVALLLWKLPRLATLRQRYYQRLSELSVRRRELVWAILLSGLMWAMDSARILLVATALRVELSVWQAIPLSMVAILGGLVPTIGGLGAVEGGLTAALCLFGASLDQALAVTALERGISYVLATAAGGLLLLALGGGSAWRAARAARVPKAEPAIDGGLR